jgi:hypothetical protein
VALRFLARQDVRQNTESLLERAGKSSRWPRVTPSSMNLVPRPGFDQKRA